jgi:hypothetical protein
MEAQRQLIGCWRTLLVPCSTCYMANAAAAAAAALALQLQHDNLAAACSSSGSSRSRPHKVGCSLSVRGGRRHAPFEQHLARKASTRHVVLQLGSRQDGSGLNWGLAFCEDGLNLIGFLASIMGIRGVHWVACCASSNTGCAHSGVMCQHAWHVVDHAADSACCNMSWRLSILVCRRSWEAASHVLLMLHE